MTSQPVNNKEQGAFRARPTRGGPPLLSSRKTAYEVFRRVLGQPYEGHEDEWASALAEVGLPFDSLPAAQMLAETLNSKAPMDVTGFRKAVMHFEKELGLPRIGDSPRSLRYRSGRRTGDVGPVAEQWTPRDEDGRAVTYGEKIERLIARDSEFANEEEASGVSQAEEPAESGLLNKLAKSSLLDPSLLLPADPSGRRRLDIAKVSQRMGLDHAERKVLTFKFRGVSREKAIDAARTDKSRKQIQAAWRRFDRKVPMESLLRALTPQQPGAPPSEPTHTDAGPPPFRTPAAALRALEAKRRSRELQEIPYPGPSIMVDPPVARRRNGASATIGKVS